MSQHRFLKLTQCLHKCVEHRAEKSSCVVVAEVKSHQYVLDNVPDQRQQATVRVYQHHRQYLWSLANKTEI